MLPANYLDVDKKFYTVIPKGVEHLRSCETFQTKEAAIQYATYRVQEQGTTKCFILECVAVVEEEKKPVTVRELS